MSPVSRPWRRWLQFAVYAATTLTLFSAVSSAAHSCHSHSGDVLIDRLESHLSQCLPSQSAVLEGFKDALNANELEAHAPLALVAFSSASEQLSRLAAAVATAVADVSPAVRVLDILELLANDELSNHELRLRLRSEMTATLRACSQKRTLFVVRGLEAVTRDRLPLLDVFLDPMNGARALLHDHETGRDIDCRRALFLFLYRQDQDADAVLTRTTWKDFLVAKWRGQSQDEAFTPQALVGRMTVAVQLQPDEDESLDIERSQACGWGDFLFRLGAARRREAEAAAARVVETQSVTKATTGVVALGESTWSPVQQAIALGFLLLFVAVLVATKRFVVSSKEMEEVVQIQQAKREATRRTSHSTDTKGEQTKEKDMKKDRVVEDESSQAAYALRSRTVVAATETRTSGDEPQTPTPRKKNAGKRPASARVTRSHESPGPGVVAPPPTPANATASSAQSSPATKSKPSRRARRATHSGS